MRSTRRRSLGLAALALLCACSADEVVPARADGAIEAMIRAGKVIPADQRDAMVEAYRKRLMALNVEAHTKTQVLQAPAASASGGSSGHHGASASEVRELKMKLARKEKENKELVAQLEALKQGKAASASNFDELQNERDQLVMKNEAL